MRLPTFKQMMNEVVFYGSCCECGSCVLVCPHHVIDYVDGKPKQVAKKDGAPDFCGISEGIGCDVCAQACPRLYPRESHLADQILGSEAPYEGVFGRYRRVVVARARDPLVGERCQDGGVVTTLLLWGLRHGLFDGAVVSLADPDKPCSPAPRAVATEEEILASAGSWYTYCPNNLALREAERKGLSSVAFVGVPCQITPMRKLEVIDPAFLGNGRKKEKHRARQESYLKGYAGRIALHIGLLCSEVFMYGGLMVGKIQDEMGIPLSEIQKFNVKGKVLIYKKDGELAEMGLRDAQEYARPECHHCGDFSAELADVSCGGVAAMGWTITVLRTELGEELFNRVVYDGLLEVRHIEQFETSMKVLRRLARKQRGRVPVPAQYDPSWVRAAS